MAVSDIVPVPGPRFEETLSPDRVNSRNGYRLREWDTRAGTAIGA